MFNAQLLQGHSAVQALGVLDWEYLDCTVAHGALALSRTTEPNEPAASGPTPPIACSTRVCSTTLSATGAMKLEYAGLNGLMLADCRVLATIATVLGEHEDARAITARGDAL